MGDVRGRYIRQVFLDAGCAPADVVDAKKDLELTVLQEDIDNAIPQDYMNCAISLACRRSFGSFLAYTLRTAAYVHRMRPNGKEWVIERYMLGERARAMVMNFDENTAEPGIYILHAPSKSATLNYKADARRSRLENIKNGKEVKPNYALRGSIRENRRYKNGKMIDLSGVRPSGTGRIIMRKSS